MKTKAKRASKAITVVNICVILLCAVLTFLLLIPTVYNVLSKENKSFFGRYLYVNTNNSLAPVMEVNDIITVQPIALSDLELGDFLCYYPVGEKANGVQFGKLVWMEENTLWLSDKQDHSVSLERGEIVLVGKATNKVLMLGELVQFLKNDQNRLVFYISLLVVVVALLGVTIGLHVKQRAINRKQEALAIKPKQYSLEDLLEVEIEPILFETASHKEEYTRESPLE